MAPRGPNLFKRTDLARALHTARDAGMVIDKVEVDRNGKITMTMKDGNGPQATAPNNPWDEQK
jgi:hypothetical protein